MARVLLEICTAAIAAHTTRSRVQTNAHIHIRHTRHASGIMPSIGHQLYVNNMMSERVRSLAVGRDARCQVPGLDLDDGFMFMFM